MLTIYGATGYTGRLAAAAAVRAGLPVRLAGRRRSALEALAAELGVTDTAVVDAEDPDGLRRLASDSTVLATTVGPYKGRGEGVLEAALAAGCHYLDVSGEPEFLAWAYAQGARAERAGVVLAPGFGLDGVCGEALAALAAERLEGPVDELRIAYLARGNQPSRGTARTIPHILADGGASWREGALAAEPLFAERWQVPFPEPLGRRAAASFPLADLVTAAHATGARIVRTYGVTAAAPVLGLLSAPASALVSVLGSQHVAGWLERAARRSPEGPSEAARRATRLAVLAEARGRGRSAMWARLRDVYGGTAELVAAAGRQLLEAAPAAGARSPSQVVAPATLLAAIGARWEPVELSSA